MPSVTKVFDGGSSIQWRNSKADDCDRAMTSVFAVMPLYSQAVLQAGSQGTSQAVWQAGPQGGGGSPGSGRSSAD